MNDYNWKHLLFATIVALVLLVSNKAHAAKDVLSTDTKVVCVTGYSSTVRSVSLATKKKVYAKAGVKYGTNPTKCTAGPIGNAYEVDHIIPLSIGGSNDISNLQLQSYCGPRNAYDKDKDEYRLLKEVCKSKTTNILKAQQQMRDWK